MILNGCFVHITGCILIIISLYLCFQLLWDVWLKYKIEYMRINIGDVYEYQSDDPWDKTRSKYIIKEKRNGWVRVYIEYKNNPPQIISLKITKLLDSKYKCTRRKRNK